MTDETAKPYNQIEAAFADAKYKFRIKSADQWPELQEKTGVGPLSLYRRLLSGAWLLADIRETIRIALIGGGMEPLKAKNLVERYIDVRPLAENVGLALKIIEASVFGADAAKDGTEAKDGATTEAGGNA
jgi:hypothetical protein